MKVTGSTLQENKIKQRKKERKKEESKERKQKRKNKDNTDGGAVRSEGR